MLGILSDFSRISPAPRALLTGCSADLSLNRGALIDFELADEEKTSQILASRFKRGSGCRVDRQDDFRFAGMSDGFQLSGFLET